MLTLIPAAAVAQKVSYDYNRSTNFKQVKSFSIRVDNKSENPLIDDRVAAALARELTARGIEMVSENPDVYIVPNMTAEMRKEYTSYNTGYGPYYGPWYWGGWDSPWYWGGGWGTSTLEVRDRQYNTLTVDVIDADTGALIWRGKGEQRVHSHWKPADIDEAVYKTVGKMMKKFPMGGSD
jgi:hypothetical protein